jgi:hypothetical protein
MFSKGYVGVFSKPFTRDLVRACVSSWLERFEKLEQIPPIVGNEVSTVAVRNTDEIMWEKNLQFRVVNGVDFAWAYLTLQRSSIETTGLPADEISLCLDVLLELPGIVEVVPNTNERRLDQLEAEGLL